MEAQMNRALLTLPAILALSLSASAQSPDKPAAQQQAAPQASSTATNVPAARPEDVKSIDSILAALYGVISGPAGERDWNRFRSLFLPEAHMGAARKKPDGGFTASTFTAEGYVE